MGPLLVVHSCGCLHGLTCYSGEFAALSAWWYAERFFRFSHDRGRGGCFYYELNGLAVRSSGEVGGVVIGRLIFFAPNFCLMLWSCLLVMALDVCCKALCVRFVNFTSLNRRTCSFQAVVLAVLWPQAHVWAFNTRFPNTRCNSFCHKTTRCGGSSHRYSLFVHGLL